MNRSGYYEKLPSSKKRQTELLTALLENATGTRDGQNDSDTVSPLDFKGFIPER